MQLQNQVNNIEVIEPQILTPMNEQLVDISKLSSVDLKKHLAEVEKKEKAALEKERKNYEASKDVMIQKIITTVSTLNKELTEFKTFCHIEMDKQQKALENYGKLRANSKGGFSVTNTEDTMRVTRRLDTEPTWDERSTKAMELIKDFLSDTVKKRDIKLYEILISFLERNAKGDLEYSRVMDLYKHEDKFDDPRWKEGLRLMKESFSNHLKGFGYEFKEKGADGKWKNIMLNFSGL